MGLVEAVLLTTQNISLLCLDIRKLVKYRLKWVQIDNKYANKITIISLSISVLPRNFKTGDNVPPPSKKWGHFEK